MTSDSQDGSFRQSLRENWHVSPRRNPDFRAAVWARIEAGRRAPATWAAWLRVNVRQVATLALVAITIAGAGGGFIARTQADHEREQLVQRYLASIDPHQRVQTDRP
jgi:hypothetical protein